MKNVKNYSRKEYNNIINAYLLSCIPSNEDIKGERDIITETDADRVNFVYDAFNSEYGHVSNVQRYPNEQDRFKNWLMSLPSAFNIDYENYRIIELCIEWGYLPTNPSEKQTDAAIQNWFNYMAAKFLSLRNSVNKTNPRNTKRTA